MSSGTDVNTTARGVLAVTCLSTLVVNANTSAVSILLPAISDDTGMSVTTLQWAVTGYSLVGAATIVTSGSLGDVFGRKRIFQLGLLLFIASCVLIALSELGRDGDRGALHPGRVGCDDPGLRAQPADGGHPRGGQAAGGLDLGRGGRRRGRRRATARRRTGRADELAGAVLGGRRASPRCAWP